MARSKTMKPIPEDVALRLCEEIRAENRGKWTRWTAWWCWGCAKASRNDPAKMCFSNDPQCRGCSQVNVRYDRQVPAASKA